MSRAPSPASWAGGRGDVEAVLVRFGRGGVQLVLVDGDGRWERWVFASEEEARAAVSGLGCPVHEGGYPEHLRVAMNGRRRAASEYERGAYPEQGRVGPVIPYPENRPRRVARTPEERGRNGP
ncbi:MAG: hypothetical protein H0V60_00045 [Actinobacteria bacterium]|nr:hypothetical protein [Actinomycetota bacterium]